MVILMPDGGNVLVRLLIIVFLGSRILVGFMLLASFCLHCTTLNSFSGVTYTINDLIDYV